MPDGEGLLHLQFRRFAGCPVCSLHLRSVARRHAEIVAAGIAEVVVFASRTEELAPHAALPFPLIADPDRRLYRDFGVEPSPWALTHPRAWWAALRGLRSIRPPRVRPGARMLGLPGDFLIAPDGTVMAVHYGRHADDQWSVDELLALAAAPASPEPGR